jgi:membrane protein DedA with SNARE-associated domain
MQLLTMTLMENWLELIKNFWYLLQQGQLPEVGRWNYLLLSALVAIEGPIATLLGAAAASAGLMRIWGVLLAAALGNMTADCLWYLVGYVGNNNTTLRLTRWMGSRRTLVERLTIPMKSHGLQILFFAKLTAGFMIPTLIAAGLARLPWKRIFPILLLGEMIWTGVLIVIGYFATEAIKNVSQDISYIILAASILFLIVIIWQGRRILMENPEIAEVIHPDENKKA